jgi:hypothetical protein
MGILFATPTRHKLRKHNRHEISINAISFILGQYVATALVNATRLSWHPSMSAPTHETTGGDWRITTMVPTGTWDGSCYKRELQFLLIAFQIEGVTKKIVQASTLNKEPSLFPLYVCLTACKLHTRTAALVRGSSTVRHDLEV